MRHVLVVMGLLLLSLPQASAGEKGKAKTAKTVGPRVEKGTNASGMDFEREFHRGRTVTTYFHPSGQPAGRVTRMGNGAILVQGHRYEIHNNTHMGKGGVRLVIDLEKGTAKPHQADRHGKAFNHPEVPVHPIELWSLPGK